jgi:hypothetical protein
LRGLAQPHGHLPQLLSSGQITLAWSKEDFSARKTKILFPYYGILALFNDVFKLSFTFFAKAPYRRHAAALQNTDF